MNQSVFAPAVVVGAPNANANRVETRTYGVSPYVRGRIGDVARYQVRVNETEVQPQNAAFAGVRTTEAVANVRNATASARLGWALDASALRATSESFGTLDDSRIRGSVIFGITDQIYVSLLEGYESTDFGRDGRESGATPGLGVQWSPSPRTNLAVVGERRFFGTGYLATFGHRAARTAVRFSAARQSALLASVLGSASSTLESVMRELLTASIPDLTAREAAARQRLGELGAAPTAISDTYYTSRPYLERSIQATVAYTAPRTTFTVTAADRKSSPLRVDVRFADAFTEAGDIHVKSGSASVIHRLSPLTTMTVAGSVLRSSSSNSGGPLSREDLGTIFMTTRLGPRLSFSAGYRHVRFEGNTSANYVENAIFGAFSLRL
jgi:uncharacterized protein (PEP-CTERM system associated)